MNTTSISLLERLRQPNEALAWDRFVYLYTPLLYDWAKGMGLQEPDAADLVQDVFTLLLQKLPEFAYDQHKSFRAWLRTVTLNKWRETYRQRRLPLAAGADLLAEEAIPDPVETLGEADYQAYLMQRALRVMQADFAPATWMAFWEMVVVGQPAPRVAVQLGLTTGAVYAAKVRVLGRLREELAGLLD